MVGVAFCMAMSYRGCVVVVKVNFVCQYHRDADCVPSRMREKTTQKETNKTNNPALHVGNGENPVLRVQIQKRYDVENTKNDGLYFTCW